MAVREKLDKIADGDAKWRSHFEKTILPKMLNVVKDVKCSYLMTKQFHFYVYTP